MHAQSVHGMGAMDACMRKTGSRGTPLTQGCHTYAAAYPHLRPAEHWGAVHTHTHTHTRIHTSIHTYTHSSSCALSRLAAAAGAA